MPKKQKTTADTGSMATIIDASAVAVGENTLTSADISVKTSEHGAVTTTKGKIKIVAAAESPDGGPVYADATADIAFSNADRVKIKTKEKSGGDEDSSYDVLVVKFKAVDNIKKSGDLKLKETTRKTADTDDDLFDLDGNVAIVNFDAEATGEDSLVTVDAHALAVEDVLSESALSITSAVG